jgi:hypothetical protein
MIILDLDRADEETKDALVKALPVAGLRAVKYRNLIHKLGMEPVLRPASKLNLDVFADMKIAEVGGSVETLVRLYAEFEKGAPRFLSISGETSEESLRAALAVRGTMDIIYVPVLSGRHLYYLRPDTAAVSLPSPAKSKAGWYRVYHLPRLAFAFDTQRSQKWTVAVPDGSCHRHSCRGFSHTRAQECAHA